MKTCLERLDWQSQISANLWFKLTYISYQYVEDAKGPMII